MKSKKRLLLVGAIVIGLVLYTRTQNDREFQRLLVPEELAIQGKQISLLEADHVPEGTVVSDYNSNPPTSGSKYPSPAGWGSYDFPIKDEVAVHNLEHGGIWITYKGVDEGTRTELEKIASFYNQAVILSSRMENENKIALASWGRLDSFDEFDKERIELFIRSNVNNSPEKLSYLEQAEVAWNEPAPSAVFTTLAGEQLKLSEYRGERVMFWFIATWCPSCIAGATMLSNNNDKLSNLTIISLENYDNAGFPGPTMDEFVEENAPDMLTASNWVWGRVPEDTAKVYNPKNFADIYFLIDEEGIVQEIDGAPAATIGKIINFANE